MIRRPPRSTLDRSSAASDVYKRQAGMSPDQVDIVLVQDPQLNAFVAGGANIFIYTGPVSYTHLRAHETVLDLVCRLLLEKQKYYTIPVPSTTSTH
mgnify:CR=1 FL=1